MSILASDVRSLAGFVLYNPCPGSITPTRGCTGNVASRIHAFGIDRGETQGEGDMGKYDISTWEHIGALTFTLLLYTML